MSRLEALSWALAALLLAHQPGFAATPDWLVGTWNGGGQHMGKASTAELTVAPALGGRYLELRYRVISPISFEGRGLYLDGTQALLTGRWFDSRGMEMPLNARWDATSMIADWGGSEGEKGRTHYLLKPDGSLEVIDEVQVKDGSYRAFAKQQFKRQP